MVSATRASANHGAIGGIACLSTTPAVTRIGTVGITNVYNKTVVNSTTVTNVSYNGGPSGLKAQPTAQEQAVSQDKHVPPTALQSQHHDVAGKNRTLLASVNGGKPGDCGNGKGRRALGTWDGRARAAPEPSCKLARLVKIGVRMRRRWPGYPCPSIPIERRTPPHHDKKKNNP